MANVLRQRFFREFWRGMRVVSPIFSALIVLMVGLGILVAMIERWPIADGLYFAFVSGLTIGYGDLVPKAPLARILSISLGLTGILLTGLIVAVGVNALQATRERSDDE